MKMPHALVPSIVAVISLLGATAPDLRAVDALWATGFDEDVTGEWQVNSSATDTNAEFFFDYSTVGIPEAPNSANGGTRGLKLQANLSSAVFGGVSVSPIDPGLPDEYLLLFDWWANTVGPFPAGGSGSTNLSTFGVGTDGTSVQWPGGNQNSVWFAATGDGGSTADWRAYAQAGTVGGFQDGDPVFLGVPTRNNTQPAYASFGAVSPPEAQAALYPSQTGVTQTGSTAFAWHRVEILKKLDRVTWTVDGVKIAEVGMEGRNLAGTNVFFGHSDINAGSSADENDAALIFTLIDNVRVEPPPVSEEAPQIVEVVLEDGKVRIGVIGQVNARYQLKSSDDLVTPFADMGEPITADGLGQVIFFDDAPPAGQRYYTVTLVP